jgi:osmotically-inducible protein OsmY
MTMKIATRTTILRLTLCALFGYGATAGANEVGETMADAAKPILVSAKRVSLNAADREVNKRVEAALDQAPYLDADHITVTSKEGIVTLEGMVGSPSDLQDALKITSRVDGVKDVVDELEIWQFGGRNW